MLKFLIMIKMFKLQVKFGVVMYFGLREKGRRNWEGMK